MQVNQGMFNGLVEISTKGQVCQVRWKRMDMDWLIKKKSQSSSESDYPDAQLNHPNPD